MDFVRTRRLVRLFIAKPHARSTNATADRSIQYSAKPVLNAGGVRSTFGDCCSARDVRGYASARRCASGQTADIRSSVLFRAMH